MQRTVLSLPLLLAMSLVGAFLASALTAQQRRAIANEGGKDSGPSSVSQLKQIGLALLMYAQDYDEVLPPMENSATVKRLLLPYVRGNEALFAHPQTHESYQPNPSLSRRRRMSFSVGGGRDSQGKRIPPRSYRADIPGPAAEVVAFYEASPAPDRTRAVLFLDGHVQVIPEAEWPRLKRASKIP